MDINEINCSFRNREEKAYSVFQCFRQYLGKNVLDVGADKQHLQNHLADGVRYVGLGLGGSPDIQLNIEEEKLPFGNQEFDCVLCLDVLEHIDNPHEVFSELCRVSASIVIISLPNPAADFLAWLRRSRHESGGLKYYGLPKHQPVDRHKWFFTRKEAIDFIQSQANSNGFDVIEINNDIQSTPLSKRSLREWLLRYIFLHGVDWELIDGGPVWAVLQRNPADESGSDDHQKDT